MRWITASSHVTERWKMLTCLLVYFFHQNTLTIYLIWMQDFRDIPAISFNYFYISFPFTIYKIWFLLQLITKMNTHSIHKGIPHHNIRNTYERIHVRSVGNEDYNIIFVFESLSLILIQYFMDTTFSLLWDDNSILKTKITHDLISFS